MRPTSLLFISSMVLMYLWLPQTNTYAQDQKGIVGGVEVPHISGVISGVVMDNGNIEYSIFVDTGDFGNSYYFLTLEALNGRESPVCLKKFDLGLIGSGTREDFTLSTFSSSLEGEYDLYLMLWEATPPVNNASPPCPGSSIGDALFEVVSGGDSPFDTIVFQSSGNDDPDDNSDGDTNVNCGGQIDSGLAMDGGMGWRIDGQLIEMTLDRVLNQRADGRSGTLRLKVWATEQPYLGEQTLSGYVLGTVSLGELNAQQAFTGISGAVPISPPPDGQWYTVMTLTEFDSPAVGDQIVDYCTFDGTSSFFQGNDVAAKSTQLGVGCAPGGQGPRSGDLSIVLVVLFILAVTARRPRFLDKQTEPVSRSRQILSL